MPPQGCELGNRAYIYYHYNKLGDWEFSQQIDRDDEMTSTKSDLEGVLFELFAGKIECSNYILFFVNITEIIKKTQKISLKKADKVTCYFLKKTRIYPSKFDVLDKYLSKKNTNFVRIILHMSIFQTRNKIQSCYLHLCGVLS